MDVKLQLLEFVLFEFDWGQELPENHLTTLAPPQVQDFQSPIPLESCLARYHNWVHAVSTHNDSLNAAAINQPNVIQTRQEVLQTIRSRMILEMPHHPALEIYANDLRLAGIKQDSVSL